VALLLEKGANVNIQGGYYGNALQAATAGHSIAIARMLLSKGAQVNMSGDNYGSALQAASFKGDMPLVVLLLDKAADPNAIGGRCFSSLYTAVRAGHETVVRLLVVSGAAINIQSDKFGMPLYLAAYQGNLGIVKYLLDKGADVDEISPKLIYSYDEGLRWHPELDEIDGASALSLAVCGSHTTVVKLLLEYGANAAYGCYFESSLALATINSDVPMVRLLLEHGVDVDRGNYYHGTTPLVIASACAEVALAMLNEPGVPPHRLQLKVGTICSIMRNLSIEKGLVKNARVRILELRRQIVRVELLHSAASSSDDRSVYLPRINFNFHPQYTSWTVERRQFPLR
jgi:ankyrin repeat protein